MQKDRHGIEPHKLKENDPGCVVSSSERFRFSYYFGRNPDYVIDASDTGYAGGDRIVVSLEDLLKALDEFPDAVVVTHSNDLFNDASVGPEVRTYLLSEMRRLDSEDDENIPCSQI